VPILSQARDLGVVRSLPGDGVLKMNAFKRRPFADRPVPDASLALLRAAAERHGAHLLLLRTDEIVALIVAASQAAMLEFADPAHRAELAGGTNRFPDAGDAIPADSVPATGPSLAPLRPFGLTIQAAPAVDERVHIAESDDRMARYAVLFTDADDLRSWLTGGEALSAVLLTATGENLAASPMSEVVEVPVSRQLMREMISGVGYPVLALCIGVPAAA
jgi:hypothetical protein